MSKHIVGIIAEYNPFHNGHLYHLEKVKEKFPLSPIILVLGGCFTQRGDISIIDKWTKTKIALEYGVDLVVELPFPFSTASADIFAKGSIDILNYLGVTDIVFGSESNDIEGIKRLVETQLYNKDFDSLVQVYLRMGYNYPTSLSKALEDITGNTYKLPNDILGISYVKRIMKKKYKIEVHAIKRENDYHNKNINSNSFINSATSIREALLKEIDIKDSVPIITYDYLKNKKIPRLDDYFNLLKYKIISSNDLTIYNLIDKGLDTKLKKEIVNSYSFDEIINKIKSKNLTYARISRMLIYILCDYTKELKDEFHDIKYIRILGFSNIGKNYLNTIKKDIKIPLISKFTREKDNMLEYEYLITKIYSLVFDKDISKALIEAEYKMKPIRKDDYMDNMIKTKKQGLLIVISGPSGCGKNSIINELLKIRKNTWVSISCTSREIRGDEKNGVNYYFLTKEEFEQEIKNDEFLEYAEYSGNYYGTPKKYIKEHLDKGEDVILEIEIQGALKIKEKLDETVFIFIMPPSMKELKQRLINRNTDSMDKIDKRFKRAYEEINEIPKYNYVVVNDKLDIAVSKVNAILEAERLRVDRIEEVYLDSEEEKVHEELLKDVKEFDNSTIEIK